MDLKDQSVLVIGYGKTGQASVTFLLSRGARVFLWDDGERGRRDARLAFAGTGLDNPRFLDRPLLPGAVDLIVPSPGVPPSRPFNEEGVGRRNAGGRHDEIHGAREKGPVEETGVV